MMIHNHLVSRDATFPQLRLHQEKECTCTFTCTCPCTHCYNYVLALLYAHVQVATEPSPLVSDRKTHCQIESSACLVRFNQHINAGDLLLYPVSGWFLQIRVTPTKCGWVGRSEHWVTKGKLSRDYIQLSKTRLVMYTDTCFVKELRWPTIRSKQPSCFCSVIL